MLQRWVRTSLALTLVLVLVACGASTGAPNGGTDDDDPDDGNGEGPIMGNDARVGFLGVEDAFSSVFGHTTDGFALFLSVSSDVADLFVDLAPDTTVASCEVTTLSFDDEPLLPELPSGDDYAFETLDAGAAVTLTASGSTYLELEKSTFDFGGEDLVFYANTIELEAPPPGITAAVPGAAGGFPAVNVPLPTV
jgi:hypothetical protein